MNASSKIAGWELTFSNVSFAQQGLKRVSVAVPDLCEAIELARVALSLKGSHPIDDRQPLMEADLQRLSLNPDEVKVDA